MDYSEYKTAVEIRILLFMLHKLMKRDAEKRLQASGAHITGLQYGVMKVLFHSSVTLSTLAHKMLVEPATLVPVIDALERKDYIKRIPDRMDRRKNYLSITENGRDMLKSIPIVDSDDTFAAVIQAMGTHKQKDLLALLRQLINGITNDTKMTDEISEIANKE